MSVSAAFTYALHLHNTFLPQGVWMLVQEMFDSFLLYLRVGLLRPRSGKLNQFIFWIAQKFLIAAAPYDVSIYL